MRTIPRFIFGTLITLGALGLFNYCDKSEPLNSKVNTPIVMTINGIDYEINGNKLLQKTEDEDKVARFGVVADPHGFYEHVEVFSKYFKQEGLDGIIMLGDYAQHFRKKPHQGSSDYDEIMKCLETAAKTGLPIYIIPGNHEMRKDYEKAVDKISQKYKNILDLSKIRIVDGDDFDFVSNPFGTDFTYPSESFRGLPEQIKELKEYVKQLKNDDDPEILLTHQPPKCKGKHGIDVTLKGENVGEELLNGITDFILSAHIHEAGGKGCTSAGELVEPKTLSNDLRFNPGSTCPWEYLNGQFYNGIAGIFTVEGDKAKYKVIVLK